MLICILLFALICILYLNAAPVAARSPYYCKFCDRKNNQIKTIYIYEIPATAQDDRNPQSEALKFYEVDALGDDYVDFGAATGPKGSFSWHATYRLEH